MKPPIDFVLLICRRWHQADGNFPPCSHWLSVILFRASGHTQHLFSVSLGWHLGIWDTFVETWKEKRTTCIGTQEPVVPVINARGLFCRDNAESFEMCQITLGLFLWRNFFLVYLNEFFKIYLFIENLWVRKRHTSLIPGNKTVKQLNTSVLAQTCL